MDSDDSPTFALQLVGSSESWTCRSMDVSEDGQCFRVSFTGADPADTVEVTVLPVDTTQRVFRRLEHVAVRYEGNFGDLSAQSRGAIAELVAAVAGTVDMRLAELTVAGTATPITIARALGRREGARSLVFGRDTLRALLAPEIREGVDLPGGWALRDVYPTSHIVESADDALRLVLDFHRAGAEERFRMVVGPRGPGGRYLAQSAHLGLSYLSTGVADPAATEGVCTLAAYVLRLRDHAGLEWEFPSVEADVAQALLTYEDPGEARASDSRSFNLAISSECGQRCTFCSIKEVAPPVDGGAAVFARVDADLSSNRAAGVQRLRLNGYDPLSYSRVLDVLERALALGYAHVDVFSPCTRLADREFCEEVVARLPESRCVYVPLYGADAASHDRVVGEPGAFDALMRAFDNLDALVGAANVEVLSVLTHDSLPELGAMWAFCGRRGYRFSAHMPYPSYEGRQDKYYTAAPRQTDVARVVLDALVSANARTVGRPQQALPVGVAPCVMLRESQGRQLGLLDWLRVDDAPMTAGTEYREESFRHRSSEAAHSAAVAPTVPCPHADTCVVREACSAELLRAYVELYGAEEFAPVSLADLLTAAGAATTTSPGRTSEQGDGPH